MNTTIPIRFFLGAFVSLRGPLFIGRNTNFSFQINNKLFSVLGAGVDVRISLILRSTIYRMICMCVESGRNSIDDAKLCSTCVLMVSVGSVIRVCICRHARYMRCHWPWNGSTVKIVITTVCRRHLNEVKHCRHAHPCCECMSCLVICYHFPFLLTNNFSLKQSKMLESINAILRRMEWLRRVHVQIRSNYVHINLHSNSLDEGKGNETFTILSNYVFTVYQWARLINRYSISLSIITIRSSIKSAIVQSNYVMWLRDIRDEEDF